jgi:hypothetical protein
VAPISYEVNHLYGLLLARCLLQISLVVVFATNWLPTDWLQSRDNEASTPKCGERLPLLPHRTSLDVFEVTPHENRHNPPKNWLSAPLLQENPKKLRFLPGIKES